MLSWAYAVLNAHAERKSILEVEYIGEEGTGLGPSLEFYALTAAELQQRSLGMWLCDDEFPDDEAREVSQSDKCNSVHPEGGRNTAAVSVRLLCGGEILVGSERTEQSFANYDAIY